MKRKPKIKIKFTMKKVKIGFEIVGLIALLQIIYVIITGGELIDILGGMVLLNIALVVAFNLQHLEKYHGVDEE
jgi:hypothetical protein